MVKIQVSHKKPLQTSEPWCIWAIMLKQMAVSWTFTVHHCDCQAKQSERSLHNHTVHRENGVCERVKLHFKTAQRAWKNVLTAFMCVCPSLCDRSSVSECARVCVLSSVTVCVLLGVCTGVYLYKDVGGVLDLWVTVQTVRHAPFHPAIQAAVETFPWS